MGMLALQDHALDGLYPMPRPNRSIEDYHPLHHRDLGALTDLDLECEAFGVGSRLYRDRDKARVAWLIERRDAVRAERRRRADTTSGPVAIESGRTTRSGTGRPLLTVRGRGELVEL